MVCPADAPYRDLPIVVRRRLWSILVQERDKGEPAFQRTAAQKVHRGYQGTFQLKDLRDFACTSRCVLCGPSSLFPDNLSRRERAILKSAARRENMQIGGKRKKT
jgi:hypothetical protein